MTILNSCLFNNDDDHVAKITTTTTMTKTTISVNEPFLTFLLELKKRVDYRRSLERAFSLLFLLTRKKKKLQ